MTPFLQTVAAKIAAQTKGAPPRSALVVVPSRRSIKYLNSYFKACIGPDSGRWPVRRTIAEFTEALSGRRRGTALELQFTLYAAWRDLMGRDAGTYDDFRAWGAAVIHDFNDVDMYLVDPAAIFANLEDFHEIETDYLEKEQRDVIHEYFGLEKPEKQLESFWKHYNTGADESEAKKRFRSKWETLLPLYRRYNELLAERKIGYPGALFRAALRAVREGAESGELPEALCRSAIFMVGFNALSTVERALFGELQKLRAPDGGELTDFYWDMPGPALAPGSALQAGRFLRKNAEKFPCSDPAIEREAALLPMPGRIEVLGCPGQTAQAKAAAVLVHDILANEKGPDGSPIAPERVAVVLPDEGLLLPLFDSLDAATVGSANVTMGYPLALLPAASLVRLLVGLQARSRVARGGAPKFVAQDVASVVSHPIMTVVLGLEAVRTLLRRIEKSGRYFVTLEMLSRPVRGDGPALTEGQQEALAEILRPLGRTPSPQGAEEAQAYLGAVLGRAMDAVAEREGRRDDALYDRLQEEMGQEGRKSGDPLPPSFEGQAEKMKLYLDRFADYARLCREHGVELSARQALRTGADQLRSATVNLQGVPLHGLQIMGMLETRALDFDCLVIPSMNEGVFPRRTRPATFIPDALRLGFGIATTRFQEQIFAYHFYRLIARARRVHLLYDTTQSGLSTGSPSRYLLQLRHLFGPGTVRERLVEMGLPQKKTEPVEVEKEQTVRDALGQYLDPQSGKKLSPSSFKTYLDCPLKFYMQYILRRRPAEEPDPFMDAAQLGTVLHDTMQRIYEDMPKAELADSPVRHPLITPRRVTAEAIGALLADKKRLAAYIERELQEVYLKGESETGTTRLVASAISRDVHNILEADRRMAPFTVLACELPVDARFPFRTAADGTEMTVGFTGKIDRLDIVKIGDEERLRIVDYKTGRDKTEFKDAADLFGDSDKHGMVQLFLYAELLPRAEGVDMCPDVPIALSLYHVPDIKERNGQEIITQTDQGPVADHRELMREQIGPELQARLREMFDPSEPFRQCEPPKDGGGPCSWCDYNGICGRQPKER